MSIRQRDSEEGTAGGVPTSDGAVRELEKAGAAREALQGRAPTAPEPAEVVPIGKFGNGAEEDAAPSADDDDAPLPAHAVEDTTP